MKFELTRRRFVNVKVKLLSHGYSLPKYATPEAAGADLYAAVDCFGVWLFPGTMLKVPLGVSIELPPGYEAQIRARSGLAASHGIGIVNGLGTIDSDYRGEICALLINHSNMGHRINRGDRVAQLVIQALPEVTFIEVDELGETDRGSGGFGSTGVGG